MLIFLARTLLLAAFSLLSTTVSVAEPNIKLAVGEHIAPNIEQSMKMVYVELFGRTGYSVEIVRYPSMRSEMMLEKNDPLLDGDTARIPSFGVKHPNLVMVKEPLR